MDLAALMQRIAQGDREAFATLYARYNQTVYQSALNKTGSHEESLTVVKAVFKDMYQAIREQGPYLGDLNAWLEELTDKQLRLQWHRRAQAALDNPAAAYAVQPVAQPLAPPIAPPVAPPMAQPVAPPMAQPVAPPMRSPLTPPPMQPHIQPQPFMPPVQPPAADASSFIPPPAPAMNAYMPPPDASRQYSEEEARMLAERADARLFPEKENEGKKKEKSTVPSFIALSLFALLLLWILIGLLSTLEILPEWDFGYTWFNETFFRLF